MATNVIMPALGVAQQTGTLLKWLKTDGQTVTKGEPLMEIETDKATVEIEAAASGILTRCKRQTRRRSAGGSDHRADLGGGRSPADKTSKHPRQLRSYPLSPRERAGVRAARRLDKHHHCLTIAPAPSGWTNSRLAESQANRQRAGNRAELAARQRPEGSILAADVLRATAARRSVAQPTATPTHMKLIPLTPMRRIVGERMTQSKQSAPHFYISMDIDMSAVSKLRSGWKERGDEIDPVDQ